MFERKVGRLLPDSRWVFSVRGHADLRQCQPGTALPERLRPRAASHASHKCFAAVKNPPHTRKSAPTLAAFRPWGSSARYRRTRGQGNSSSQSIANRKSGTKMSLSTRVPEVVSCITQGATLGWAAPSPVIAYDVGAVSADVVGIGAS